MGSTPLAAAEPESGGNPGHSQSSGPGPQRTKAAPGENPGSRAADLIKKTIFDVTSVFGSGRVPGQAPATPSTPSTPSEPTVDDTPVTATSDNNQDGTANPGSDTSSAITSDTVAPVTNNDSPSADPVTPAADPVAPAAPVDAAPPVTDEVAPAADPVPAVTTPVAPAAAPVPATVFWPVKPVVDAITSVQYMLTSVAYTLAPIATDLSSLFGVAEWTPVVNPIRSDRPVLLPGNAVPILAASSMLAPLPELSTDAVVGRPLSNEPGTATVGTVAATTSSEETGAPAEDPLPPMATIPASVKQFFGHAVQEVLRSPSLSALAALALPGVVGLLIITGAGIRFGYRQAKAVLALPASGLARYAPPQPLRLVRSRSSATVSRQALRFVSSELRALPSVGPPLENAA